MSGDQGNPPPQDALAEQQVLFTDLRRVIAPFFGQQSFGDNKETAFNKTSFDGFDLNDLVDLVDNAKPDDMEAVGNALYQAAEKIEQVGTDLAKHIEGVAWEGEAGEAFRKWGGDLAKNTKKLGTFTGSAGVQIKAAGIGLTEVRSAMPPRDDGGVGPKVADIKSPARVKSNPDFVKAEKADAAKRESVRQEAIIQMDKLSSYYQVSHDTMYAAEEPMFKPMPNIGMPVPPAELLPERQFVGGGVTQPVSGVASVGAEVGAGSSGAVPHSGVQQMAGPTESVVESSAAAPDRYVGTEIDSVEAPPARNAADSPRNVAPSAPGGTGPTLQAGPLGSSAPVRPVGPKFTHVSGKSGTSGPLGRQSPAGPAGPVARPSTGPSAPVGRPATPTTPQPAGRNGIYGGQPTSRMAPTSSASRIPRGTVIGSESTGNPPMGRGSTATGGSTAAPMRGGASAGSPARRLSSAPGGVLGNPRAAAGNQRSRTFTPGGTGLVHGGNVDRNNAIGSAPRGQSPSGRDRERSDARRPEYLVEDEETWSAGRRDSAPPVVE
ncbi:hypothetical protein [Streptomyces phytohabitans]|uniref:WXG100 family type VII secretion target n=1 Tax=Streptomyces phytohabitans TaxID=1150371 RepID=UPI00345C5734